MADTPLTRADHLTDLATNTTNAIGSDDIRSIIKSMFDTFGSMYGTPTWASQPADTYAKIQFVDGGAPVGGGITADYVTDDDLTVNEFSDGAYFIYGHAAGAISAMGHVELAIFKGVTELTDLTCHAELKAGADEMTLTTAGIVSLVETDAISLQYKHVDTGSTTFTIDSAGLHMVRVGDETPP